MKRSGGEPYIHASKIKTCNILTFINL